MNKLLIILIITLISCTQDKQYYFSCNDQNNIQDKTPKFFKPDNRPKATAGVMLYHKHNGRMYVLLGRERLDQTSSEAGKYSEFSGSMELVDFFEPEIFIDGAKRELREETIGIYDLSKEYLKQNSNLCYQQKKMREVAIFLTKAPYYTDGKTLKNLRDKSYINEEKDKDEFDWIDYEDLAYSLKQNNIIHKVKNIEGNFINIKLRNYFKEMFMDANVQNQFKILLKAK